MHRYLITFLLLFGASIKAKKPELLIYKLNSEISTKPTRLIPTQVDSKIFNRQIAQNYKKFPVKYDFILAVDEFDSLIFECRVEGGKNAEFYRVNRFRKGMESKVEVLAGDGPVGNTNVTSGTFIKKYKLSKTGIFYCQTSSSATQKSTSKKF